MLDAMKSCYGIFLFGISISIHQWEMYVSILFEWLGRLYLTKRKTHGVDNFETDIVNHICMHVNL